MIMQSKKTVYLYPFTKATLRQGGNTYIPNVMQHLGRHYRIANTQTNRGLLDVLLKMPKCDVLYFNWIEDVADKKFGALQVGLLALILAFAKMTNKKIVWFLHNNLSHRKKNLWLKKRVVALMKHFSDIVLSHSREAKVDGLKQNIQVFDHPIDDYYPIMPATRFAYDLLIWGTVSPYKGVSEFLAFNQNTTALRNYKILIAGKFVSPEYYEVIQTLKAPNVLIENKILSEDELVQLFAASQFVLFTYNATSVLSSAALCKTLSYGKTIIGPETGAFKELGSKGLIYNYNSFEELEYLLKSMEPNENNAAFQHKLQEYIHNHTWSQFADFVTTAINGRKKQLHSKVAS